MQIGIFQQSWLSFECLTLREILSRRPAQRSLWECDVAGAVRRLDNGRVTASVSPDPTTLNVRRRRRLGYGYISIVALT